MGAVAAWVGGLPASCPRHREAAPQGDAAAQLSPEARRQLAQAVVAGVSGRYLALADDTLRCWPPPKGSNC